MDLKQLDTKAQSEKGSFLHILDVEGNPFYDGDEAVGLILKGMDSFEYRREQNKLSNRLLNEKRGSKQDIKELQERNIRMMAAVTIECVGMDVDGEPVTADGAVQLYTDYPFIYEQAKDFVEDRANFLES